MLNTKDVRGYLAPLAEVAQSLTAVEIPGETATLSADETAEVSRLVGFKTFVADDFSEAVADIVEREPHARVLICGSLYLAGRVLQENG